MKVEQTGWDGTSIDDQSFKVMKGTLRLKYTKKRITYTRRHFIKEGNIEILIDGGWHYDEQMNQAFIEVVMGA